MSGVSRNGQENGLYAGTWCLSVSEPQSVPKRQKIRKEDSDEDFDIQENEMEVMPSEFVSRLQW